MKAKGEFDVDERRDLRDVGERGGGLGVIGVAVMMMTVLTRMKIGAKRMKAMGRMEFRGSKRARSKSL